MRSLETIEEPARCHLSINVTNLKKSIAFYKDADFLSSLKGVAETVYTHSDHLLPTGNKIVAARILDQLLSCGFLEKHSG